MKKNLLLLNQKKYLTFINYKKLINQSKKTQNNFKLILSTDSNTPIQNLKQNSPKYEMYINNDQILAHRNSSNNLFKESKSLKTFSLNKVMPSIKISKNIFQNDIIKRNQLVKYINKKNKDIKTQLIKELFKDNKYKKYINKRYPNYFENKNTFNKNNIRHSMNCYFHYHKRYESFCLGENKKEINNDNNNIIKSQNQCISSRKINKETFVNGIHKILKEQRGKKKIKYKIIGALKTEPNYI